MRTYIFKVNLGRGVFAVEIKASSVFAAEKRRSLDVSEWENTDVVDEIRVFFRYFGLF